MTKCAQCGKPLHEVETIHSVEGMLFCSKECATNSHMETVIKSAKDAAAEWYNSYAEEVTPEDIGIIAKQVTYTAYSVEHDMTFIMRDTVFNGKTVSTECVGWYYGQPEEATTIQYDGSLKAYYNKD